MLQTIPFVSILLIISGYVQCEGHYAIVAPQNIRPNSDYHVSVSLHENPTPCEIRVAIEGVDNYRNSREINIQPFTSQLLRFDTGFMLPGEYKIKAEGLSGIDIHNESSITYQSKNASIFVQSDKAVYKPGDLLRFRVLVLDMNMKPILNRGSINIYITDGAQNRLKQWLNVKPTRGVFGDELQLSSFPVLGDWLITVETMGETKKYKFEVAEYILPKFDVTIDTPKHQHYKEGKLRATIRTKYTYGKPVKGEVTVSVYPKTYGSFQPLISNLITRKVLKINGKAFVEFDIKNELNFNEDYEQAIAIEAVVEEELTGRKQNMTNEIALHKSKYKIELSKSAEHYKPGLPFSVNIAVLQFDGTPVTGKSNEVLIRQSNNRYGDENVTESRHTLDSNGMLRYNVVVTHKSGLSLKVIYMDAEESLGWISVAESKAGVFLQAILKTEKPKLNNEVSIEVQSNENMRYLSYQVLGRGDIIVTNTVEIPNRKSHTISFLASFAMVPKAQIIIHYVKDDEIISDKLNIEFGDDLQNFVELQLSAQQASPGQDIDITVISKPNSYIGLLGVDQSVLLLRKGNDLDKSQVFGELEEYTQRKASVHRWNGYANTDWEDFSNAGAILLTNARPIEKPILSTTLSPYENEIIQGKTVTTIKKTDIGPAHVLKTNTRPPLAGPYAFSRIPKPYWNRPRVHLMHAISDTWLFANFSSGIEGRHTIHKKVPDTITSWVITGFSLDPITGLGLTKQPKNLQVFQPFFVALNLPYSVKRGEVLSIPVVVFNYLENSMNAEVTLHNADQEFDFVEMTNEIETPKIELYRRKTISIDSSDGTALSFMIKPKRVGPITIRVTAKSAQAGDGIERVLQVEPEGVAQYQNLAVFVDLREKSEFNSNLTFVIPKNAVPDSTRIEVSAVGDILGGAIKNMDKLIRMPHGCGEQNMLDFVPNIVILDYLKSSNQLTPAVETKAKKFLESGYQRELSYKHDDGSYSAFGKSDASGSTWLTAFVARSFIQATRHIDVEPKVIDDALHWLSKVQTPSGNFPEVGRILSAEMQGGAGRGIALTAYVLVAFLEDKSKFSAFRNVINKAIDYVVRNLEGSDDLYSLAVASYALQLAKHNSKNYILQTLDSRAMRKDDLQWWEKPIPSSDSKNIWYKQPNSINVEMTAYGLLALLEAGLYADALPIMKWLLNQRNELGGFQSTQDTVVGLQALSKFAERVSTASNNVRIGVKYNEGAESRINVNSDNSLIQQTYELPNTVRQVNISATGSGFALLQLSYKYNLNVTGAWPRFTLDPQPNKNSNPDYLHLTVCTSFVPDASTNESNMAVMEVQFPSGFTADLDTLPSLEVSENVKKVETKDGDTVVVIYFDHLSRKELCPTLDAFRTQKVAMHKPAAVNIYDYYDNSRRARQFYRMRETTLCDICEGSDCSETCQVRASEQRRPKSAFDDNDSDGVLNKSFGHSIAPAIYTYVISIVAILTTRSFASYFS